MGRGRPRKPSGRFRAHSLSLTVAGILALWLVLYLRGDPSTHLGAFYGNALADWLGSFVIVIATKYFFEIGSKGRSRKCPHGAKSRANSLASRPEAVLPLAAPLQSKASTGRAAWDY